MLLAVALSVLVAATLLATGPVLAAAVAEGGLTADLEQAPPADTGIQVEVRTSASRAAEVVAVVRSALDDRLGDSLGPADVLVTAGTVHLAGQPRAVVTPVAVDPAAFVVDGDDPLYAVAPGPGGTAVDPYAASVGLHRDALDELGLTPGEVVATDDGAAFSVGPLLEPVDRTDRRWWDDPFARDGVVPGVSFVEVGPLFVSDLDQLRVVLGEDDPRVLVRVRSLPVIEAVTTRTLPGIEDAARELPQDIPLALRGIAARVAVDVPLASFSSGATVALAATRAAVVATIGQVAVLAIYTLGLAGRLLRSGRDVETMLLRARGATPGQLGWAAGLEGLVLVLPAVAAGPWLAVVATRLVGRWLGAGGSGVQLDPVASRASLLAAVVAGLACLVVLVVPAVTSARRTYAAARGGRGRRNPVGVAQALGLDLALALVAGIGVWQLRAAGGPVGGVSPRSPGDVDPVLVLAPALGLLAGALLVLRLVPLLARGAEGLVRRSQGLLAGLGGWQVARRPDAISRPTLLLVLGVAVGVLAATYGATWRTSQSDQAVAAVGADVVVSPDQRAAGVQPRDVAAVIAADEAVATVVPAYERRISLVAGGVSGQLLGITAASPQLRLRADLQPTEPLAALDVPAVAGLALPAGDRLTLDATLAPDPDWPGHSLDVGVVVADGDGLVHVLPSRTLTAGGPTTLEWALSGMRMPVDLLAVELTTRAGVAPPLPAPQPLPPDLDLSIGPPTVDGAPVAPGRGWATDPWVSTAPTPPSLDAAIVTDQGFRVRGRTGLTPATGVAATLRLVHPAADAPVSSETPVPALVHPDVLDDTARALGDELVLAVTGAPLRVELVGTIEVVPGHVDAQRPVLVDLDAVVGARWTSGRAVTRPTAWRVSLDDDLTGATRDAESTRLVTDLAAAVSATDVRSVTTDTAVRTNDPIALGLLAALALGAVAAIGLALLGTISTAVVGVRERAAEFALLQAVGTSVRQLGWWLASEVALVVLVGLAAGGALGALLVWAVLPTVALAADGTLAVPAPEVVVPLATLTTAVALVIAAFATVPVVLSRVVARAHVAEVLRLGEDT